MKILFFTELSPFPVNGGERIRSYGLLKVLNNLNYDVTAVVGNEDNIDFEVFKKKYKLKNVKIIELEKRKSKSKVYRLFEYFIKDKDILIKLNNLNLINFDTVIIDYCFLGQYIQLFKNLGINVIYGTHNSQPVLTKQQETNGLFSYLKKNINYFFQTIHEHLYFKKADKLLVVSENDLEYHKKFLPTERLEIIPNFLDESLYSTNIDKKSNYIIMTANFNAFQNKEGLRWFLKSVWDEEISKMIKLKLVGKGSLNILSDLNLPNINNVEEIGEVESVNNYISEALISIIPLLHGSGTRLKCLESMSLRTQIIGTSLGVQGINHENSIIEANNPSEYKKAILDFLHNHKKYEKNIDKAYNIYYNNYSINSVKYKLQKII